MREKVKLIKEVFSHVTNRMVPVGTIGELLATRKLKGDDTPKALVKFKGFSCPISLDLKDISREAQR